MAIESFNLAIDGREIVGNDDGTITVTENRIAVLDTAETNPKVILEDPLVPGRFSAHPLWNFVRLRSIDATGHDQGRKVWTFKLEYGSEVPDDLENENSSFSPERYKSEDQQQVSWSFGVERKPAIVGRCFIEDVDSPFYGTFDDNFGHLYWVSNSAGDGFVPHPQINYKFPVAHVVRNQLVVPEQVLSYTETTNIDSFKLDGLTIDEQTAYMRDIKVSPIKYDRQRFFRTVTYDIAFKPLKTIKIRRANRHGGSQPVEATFQISGWAREFVDEGFRYLEVNEKTKQIVYRTMTDSEGNEQKTPTFLDGYGQPLDWTKVFPELVNPGGAPDLPNLEQRMQGLVYMRYLFLTPKPFAVFNFH